MAYTRWVYQWRGVLLATLLVLLGHVWIGFIWRVAVVPSAPMVAKPGSAPTAAVLRFISMAPAQAVVSAAPPSAVSMPSELSAAAQGTGPESEGLQMGVFVPSAKLDSPLVPMSAPDTNQLDGLNFSGQLIRLRLLVNAAGQVAEVLVLQAAPEDAEAVEHIKAMFFATTYIPGRLHGQPVAAQIDMELQLGYLEQ
jgi:hypothetical protein